MGLFDFMKRETYDVWVTCNNCLKAQYAPVRLGVRVKDKPEATCENCNITGKIVEAKGRDGNWRRYIE